jgi:hypothetical protein
MGRIEEEGEMENMSRLQHILSTKSSQEMTLSPERFSPLSQISTPPELSPVPAKPRQDSLVPQNTSTCEERTSTKEEDTSIGPEKSTPPSIEKHSQDIPESTYRPTPSTTTGKVPNQSEGLSRKRRSGSTATSLDLEANGTTISTFPTQEDPERRDDGTGLIVTVHRREPFRHRVLTLVLQKCSRVSSGFRRRRALWR